MSSVRRGSGKFERIQNPTISPAKALWSWKSTRLQNSTSLQWRGVEGGNEKVAVRYPKPLQKPGTGKRKPPTKDEQRARKLQEVGEEPGQQKLSFAKKRSAPQATEGAGTSGGEGVGSSGHVRGSGRRGGHIIGRRGRDVRGSGGRTLHSSRCDGRCSSGSGHVCC